MADVVEVIQHWQAGATNRGLARSLGMGRDRVRQVVRVAEAAGLSQSGLPLTRDELRERVPHLFAERMTPLGSKQSKKLRQYRGQIEEGLKTNTAQTVWQRLRDEHGLDVSIRTFRRYVTEHVRGVSPDQVTVRNTSPKMPGEVAEVDYGRMGIWEDRVTGKRRVIQAFVMTLVYSRRVFVDVVDCCDQESWVRSHVRAFAFFGGAPAKIRLDNLKTGVVKADVYDPQLNLAYAEMGEHYGILLDPCRAGKPKDKPHVERNVPYVRDSFWRGREFGTRDAMREAALRWCRDVADTRPHRTQPGTVGEVFAATERQALKPLPGEAFEIACWAKATVHPDCHAQVRNQFYSVNWELIGEKVDVRIGERLVTLYIKGALIKTHVRRRGERWHTDPADFPDEKIAFLQRTPAWCLRQAADLGDAVTELVKKLLTAPYPLSRLRQVQSLIALAKTYPAARINVACQRALEADGSHRTVKNILANGFDIADDDETTHISNAGAFLHGQQILLEGAR